MKGPSGPRPCACCQEQRRVKSGCQLFANTAAERLFGAAGAQLAGEPIEHLLPERLRARHEALHAEFLSAPRTRPVSVSAATDLTG